eukprot:TRINITY_DN70940_c0_g1_i1.p2 TRINITY_DN70940_c0_g1~~TRINITY_DN70940_c0_g1_i1.p2  ORF type:complete len:208 (+),score=44.84 TRINITY_DN70940_c0_g1_i1:77-625(+)
MALLRNSRSLRSSQGGLFGAAASALRSLASAAAKGSGSVQVTSSGPTSGFGSASGASGGSPFAAAFGSVLGSGALRPIIQQMLAHCEEAHARQVAQRMGMDVSDLRFEFSPGRAAVAGSAAPAGALPAGDTEQEPLAVRVYVRTSAPAHQVAELGRKVSQECPVARLCQATGTTANVQWLKG